MKKSIPIHYFNLFTRKLLLLGISLGVTALTPIPTLAAESLRFNYGILDFSLSLDSLELYAKEGKINSELNFYTKHLDERTVKQLRRVLRRRISIDPILLYHVTRSPMVVEIIKSLGEVATTHRGYNGFYAIRGSVVNAAFEYQERGITLIDVLREFPGEDILLDTAKLVELKEELTSLVEYREAAIKLVIQKAQIETNNNITNSLVPQKDLRNSGGINFTQQTITINSRMGNKSSGIRKREPFQAQLYLPQGLAKPVPIVVLSHGFGSESKSFDYLGEHLASYGIAAVSQPYR